MGNKKEYEKVIMGNPGPELVEDANYIKSRYNYVKLLCDDLTIENTKLISKLDTINSKWWFKLFTWLGI